MGSFEGHWIPGVAYSLLALWWGFVTAVRYAREKRRNRAKYKGSTYMPCFCCPSKRLRVLPIESFLKVFGLSYHIYRELHDGILRDKGDNHLFLYLENAHHICMLIGFIWAAVVEILIYYKVPLPDRAEWIFNGVAFLIQVLIMVGHESPGLEWHLHKLWTTLIVCTFLAGILEFYDPTNIWFTYMRVGFFLCQGSWLLEVAFVLWPHTTNPRYLWQDDHTGRVWMTIHLMLHLLNSLSILMVQYVLVYYSIDWLDKMYTRYEIDVENGGNAQVGENFKYNFHQGNEYAALLNNNEDENTSGESINLTEISLGHKV